jgi:hypothetical protein
MSRSCQWIQTGLSAKACHMPSLWFLNEAMTLRPSDRRRGEDVAVGGSERDDKDECTYIKAWGREEEELERG